MLSLDSDLPYKCTLSEEDLAKAKRELREDPATRMNFVKELRARVTANPNMTCSTSDGFLLRFLRARKFDLERSYLLLNRYLEVREEYPELFSEFTPKSMEKSLGSGMFSVMPGRDSQGRVIMYMKPGMWKPDEVSFDEAIKSNFLQVEMITREEWVQVNGIAMVYDMADIGFTQIKHMNPFGFRKITSILQDAFPARVKTMDHINMPSIMEALFNLFKSFWKGKFQERFRVFSSSESLFEQISRDNLPESVGGTVDWEKAQKAWVEKLKGSEDYFKELNKYKLIKTQALANDKKLEDAITGASGTFRKLNID